MLSSQFKNFIIVLSLFCLTLGTAFPVAASADTKLNNNSHQVFLPLVAQKNASPVTDEMQIPAEFQDEYARSQMYESAIRKMEKYIYITEDGTLALDFIGAASIDMSNAINAELLASMEVTNNKLRSGELGLDEVDLTTFDDEVSAAAVFCNGKNKIKVRWWGLKVYFDSCKVNILAGSLAAATALAAVYLTPVAALILLAEFAWFQTVAQLGGNQRGMYFAQTWVGIHWWGRQ